jgi:hypothetical protein
VVVKAIIIVRIGRKRKRRYHLIDATLAGSIVRASEIE